MLEDRLLIWKLRQNRPEALQRLYEKYKNALLKLAVVLCSDVNTAEDVVQDVFISFAGSARRIRPIGNPKKYLMTCVANRIRNIKRDEKRHKTSDIEASDVLISGSKRPEQWAILSEQLQILSSAMSQIPRNQREVIALYMQGNMNFRQIAKMQDTPASTARVRYNKGMNTLRALLNSEVEKE